MCSGWLQGCNYAVKLLWMLSVKCCYVVAKVFLVVARCLFFIFGVEESCIFWSLCSGSSFNVRLYSDVFYCSR